MTHLSHIGLLLLRLGFGLSLAFAHGLGKIPPSDRLIEGVAKIGFPLPTFFAWAAALSEFGGALFLALGLFVRPAAAFVAFTMAVAFFRVHAADPFKVKEMAFLYLIASLTLLLTGGGKYSLGNFLPRRKS